ncbi:uncharacterized protein E0L32_004771 [Thyridium curvatum]|uniref:Uncharacterized protein n=1 Tax=Thyridium curvatum TaxID=1093900 RepID=A0A507B5X3_9PEZI|nr:uncharacterized protein E0L32_004771 [Thyridium curvatum]TPX15213.1 hypothetical protein E0L32_004771 [Thyridium curvatum]
MPKYNITKMNFEEITLPGQDVEAMAAEIRLSAFNKYPVEVDIPELSFEVLIPDCNSRDPYIIVADATTSQVAVRPRTEVVAEVHGVIRELSESLVKACPNSDSSPLDLLLKRYMSGGDATVFVRGKRGTQSDTPNWVSEILSSVTVPVPFPGRTFDNLIEDFSLTDVHFTLPDPLAEPDDPDANPKVSGSIVVTAGLPSEMNFDINVTNVRATADVFYRAKKLGELNLRKWQHANSTREEATDDHHATLKIQSQITDAPLNVTDGDVLSDVVQALLFGEKKVLLGVRAHVDVMVKTVLGQLVLKDVPAEGEIPVKPVARGALDELHPGIEDLQILDTTEKSISLQASVNLSNPTPYSAHIPSISIHIVNNGSILGEAMARGLDVSVGNNSNLVVQARWDPTMSGGEGARAGRTLLSEYLSGSNASITLKMHKHSIPGQPLLCEALSRFNITVNIPRLELPGGAEDDRPRFIRDAIFHLVSSTATFTLASPLQQNTLYIDSVNATAFYNHTEPVATINHDLPVAVVPGLSQTPKLPVDWSLDSVGREKLREALGGTLKLDAKADIAVRLGHWQEVVWYEGQGINARVRL